MSPKEVKLGSPLEFVLLFGEDEELLTGAFLSSVKCVVVSCVLFVSSVKCDPPLEFVVEDALLLPPPFEL